MKPNLDLVLERVHPSPGLRGTSYPGSSYSHGEENSTRFSPHAATPRRDRGAEPGKPGRLHGLSRRGANPSRFMASRARCEPTPLKRRDCDMNTKLTGEGLKLPSGTQP